MGVGGDPPCADTCPCPCPRRFLVRLHFSGIHQAYGPGGEWFHALEMPPTPVVIGCFVEQVLGPDGKLPLATAGQLPAKSFALLSPILTTARLKRKPRCFLKHIRFIAIKSYTSSNVLVAPSATTPASCAFWPCTSGEPASKPTSAP
jgi:hypothetical protein